jgi:hypothetical protein
MSLTYLPRKGRFLSIIGILLIIGSLNSVVAKTNSPERWQRIRTPHYDIIFLSNMPREAQRVANTLETLYTPVSKTLSILPKRIPIILRSQRAQSNGFVTLTSPRRGEFYTFPTQNYTSIHNNDWLNLLAVHELRHVAQHEIKLKYPVSLSFDIPDWKWVLEGDAVGTETALSKAGRGRAPYFELLYKVNLLERGGFSYFKQMNCSYQHQIPDHYRMGYFITTYLKRKYGNDIISKLMQRDNIWEIINPFTLHNRSRKLTSRSLTQIYQDVNTELKELWTKQLENLKITSFHPIHTRNSEEYIDYKYPQPTSSGIIAIKSGIGTITHFTYINEAGKENHIFTPGPIDSDIRFSAAKDKIVWIEHMPALRWEHKRYTAIQSYNIITKRYKTIAYPSRYSTAALSPDATKLIAVETDEAYNHKLMVLDAETGTILYYLPNPANNYYLTPTWSPDGKYIVTVKHVQNKAGISLIDPQTGKSQDILPYTEELIGCPILHDSYIYYSSAYSGIDNIYAMHINTKQRFQVTSSKYGAYNPAVSTDGKWLLYNDFGKDGMNAVKMLLDSTQWTPIEKVEDRNIHYYQPLIDQADILTQVPNNTHAIEEYSTWKIFNNVRPQFSMLPTHNYGDNIMGGFVFRDILGDSELVLPGLGYKWHKFTKHTGRIFTSFTYMRWYPIVNISASILPTIQVKNNSTEISTSQEYQLNLNLPFTWNFHAYTYNIVLNTSTIIKNLTKSNTWARQQTYIAYFSRFLKKSLRDIYSPWGQKFKVDYIHTPYGGPQLKGIGVNLKVYFPGLYKHHSFRIGIKQQHNLSKFHSISFFKIPRGLDKQENYQNSHRTHRISVNYAFPISYPDIHVTSFVFIERLRANLFYDYGYHFVQERSYHIIGADFIIDTQWFHVGLRCMYKINTNDRMANVLLK